MEQQIKSRQRVTEYGEVFTGEREVKAMCDLVDNETNRIDSRFLEPACGDGNFLAEILTRKLARVKKQYKSSHLDYEKNAILALSSMYGVDILLDNCIACRERLFKLWDDEYTAVCKKDANDETREAAKFILKRNIVCGNALTLMCVDENCNDTKEPIVFSEWSFVMGSQILRKDYRLDVLLRENKSKDFYSDQMSIFFDEANSMDNWMIDPITQRIVPKPVREFPSIHYRRVQENG